MLAARGNLTAAEAAFNRALSEHDRVEMPFERGRTLLCMGRVKRRAKQRKAARETLGGALEIFERVSASLWAERARQELARTHVREAPLELSPSEAQVVQLAAQGLKNREIAERLFLSPKTVEANLARAYRKLGVRSRAELGAAMAKQVASRSS
jgi:DNA-binding NarL/FixJ family response regulator